MTMTASLFALPFNRPVYQPLCLAIGAGLPILAPNGVSS
jgi:hypothetical protein